MIQVFEQAGGAAPIHSLFACSKPCLAKINLVTIETIPERRAKQAKIDETARIQHAAEEDERRKVDQDRQARLDEEKTARHKAADEVNAQKRTRK